ncbi:MAG: hypothetical protein ACK5PG_11715 [Lysobacterales bacterium]
MRGLLRIDRLARTAGVDIRLDGRPEQRLVGVAIGQRAVGRKLLHEIGIERDVREESEVLERRIRADVAPVRQCADQCMPSGEHPLAVDGTGDFGALGIEVAADARLVVVGKARLRFEGRGEVTPLAEREIEDRGLHAALDRLDPDAAGFEGRTDAIEAIVDVEGIRRKLDSHDQPACPSEGTREPCIATRRDPITLQVARADATRSTPASAFSSIKGAWRSS